MPVLDGKGRLFGLINVIDLLMLLVVLALLAGAGYKVFDPRATSPYETVRFEFIAPAVRPQVAQTVKVGDLLNSVNSAGSALPLLGGSPFDHPVRIISVQVRQALLDVTTAAGTRVRSPDPYLRDVIIWCRGKTPVTGGSIDLAGTQIRAGTDLIFASNTYQLNGYVLRMKIGYVKALEADADDYLAKPFAVEELLARVGRCCGGKRVVRRYAGWGAS